jgi:hypothetical protein
LENMSVPASYRKLHEPDVVYPFDGSPKDQTGEEAFIRSADLVIYAYTELGIFSRSGEDIYLRAALLSHAGWGDKEELQRFFGRTAPKWNVEHGKAVASTCMDQGLALLGSGLYLH